jgi:hypothetical protein
MKIAVAILFFTAVFVLAAEQESPSTMSRPVPSIGLDECMVTSPSRFFCTARADLRQRRANYPSSRTLYLEAIKERVPVFDGKFKITQDVTVSASKLGDGARALFAVGKRLSIEGELQYQACDKTVCYPPTSVPVKWELKIPPLDLTRSPKALQHKASDKSSES